VGDGAPGVVGEGDGDGDVFVVGEGDGERLGLGDGDGSPLPRVRLLSGVPVPHADKTNRAVSEPTLSR
jgi:hypothetical protein